MLAAAMANHRQARGWGVLQPARTAAVGHPTTETEIAGRQAYGGLDVGAVSDLTPLVWVVPCRHIEGAWDVFLRVFPSETALTSRNADLYRSWRHAGWLTPGEVFDYRRVTDAILGDARQLDRLPFLGTAARIGPGTASRFGL